MAVFRLTSGPQPQPSRLERLRSNDLWRAALPQAAVCSCSAAARWGHINEAAPRVTTLATSLRDLVTTRRLARPAQA